MLVLDWIAGALVVSLLVYLALALFKPELFE
ncbi:MAG: potassium-transporting ATPase subunit F [Planctomycetes bacterium]|nr:potassium-transporting ATPase subunit F [Planctomycetota bacterium]